MSKKLTLNGWIVFEQWRWDKDNFTWYGFRPDDEVKRENFKRAVVCEQAIEVKCLILLILAPHSFKAWRSKEESKPISCSHYRDQRTDSATSSNRTKRGLT